MSSYAGGDVHDGDGEVHGDGDTPPPDYSPLPHLPLVSSYADCNRPWKTLPPNTVSVTPPHSQGYVCTCHGGKSCVIFFVLSKLKHPMDSVAELHLNGALVSPPFSTVKISFLI